MGRGKDLGRDWQTSASLERAGGLTCELSGSSAAVSAAATTATKLLTVASCKSPMAQVSQGADSDMSA